MLNPVQADAVLDIVAQCRVVWDAWEQKEASRHAPDATATAAQTDRGYQTALSALGMLSAAAEDDLGVDHALVEGIFLRNLPDPVLTRG